MSWKIAYPFIEHQELIHDAGFKFMEEQEAWVSYREVSPERLSQLPKNVADSIQEFVSFYDVLERLKQKPERVIHAQDPEFEKWCNLSIRDSQEALAQAEQESINRKKILQQVRKDFHHPFIVLKQGGGYGIQVQENQIISIAGTLTTYHRKGLNSLFHELGHFLSFSEERIKSRNFTLSWPKKVKNFMGTLNELKTVALTETIADHYQVPRPDRYMFLTAIAEYPDSELFFKAHMHLVSVFNSPSFEDHQQDKIDYQYLIKKDNFTPEAAMQAIKKRSEAMLHLSHKLQVLQAFFDQKIVDKYTIDHIHYLFKVQTDLL